MAYTKIPPRRLSERRGWDIADALYAVAMAVGVGEIALMVAWIVAG